VPALEVLPNVESGIYPIGHTASYYYTDRAEFTAFGTSLPFGLTVRQQNAWLYEAGGLDQLQLLYRDRFGMIQFPAGATGAQMGGWFNREIRSMADLQGLKMRIPGLGGRVMERLGVAVQQVPGDEILEALRTQEEELSAKRHQVFQVADACSGELTRRYRDGEADVADLLATPGE